MGVMCGGSICDDGVGVLLKHTGINADWSSRGGDAGGGYGGVNGVL